MIKDVALILLARLDGATYLDRKSGVVQVVRKVDVISDGVRIEKRFPFSHSATYQDCLSMRNAMIPNSAYMSCLYFEDMGVNVLERRREFQFFQARLRLVCWLNLDRIAGIYSQADTSKIMGDIIRRVTSPESHTPQNGSIFRVIVEIAGIPEQSADLFAKYDYDEAHSQYLMPPYDFFAIDLNVKFGVRCDTLTEPIEKVENDCVETIPEPEPEITP